MEEPIDNLEESSIPMPRDLPQTPEPSTITDQQIKEGPIPEERPMPFGPGNPPVNA